MRATMPPYTSQQPTGAYRSTEVIGDKESRLRTALSFINHARDLVRAELGDDQPQIAKQAYDDQTRRDVSWSAKRGDCTLPKWHAEWGKPRNDELPPNLAKAVTAPNCDGLPELLEIGIGDVPLERSIPPQIPNWAKRVGESEAAYIERVPRFTQHYCDECGFIHKTHPMNAAALEVADEYHREDQGSGV